MKKIISLTLALLLLVGTFASAYIVQAADDDVILNDATGIPDPVFYALALAKGDNNGDGKLTVEEAKSITDLSCKDDVTNITGISYLSELRRISFSGEFLDLSFLSELKDCKNIEWFALLLGESATTDISSLSVIENWPNLEVLQISDSQVSDISVLSALANCSNLTTLHLPNNKISDISVLSVLENCTKLEGVYLNNNVIKDISSLSSLSNSPNLDWLALHENEISDISPLSALKSCNIVALQLNDNQISDLSAITDLPTLIGLDVSNNLLSSLPDMNKMENLMTGFEYCKTNFSGNKLTEAELKAKMPSQLASNQEWIDANKYVPADDSNTPDSNTPKAEHVTTKPMPTIPANLPELLNADDVSGVTVTLTEADKVSSNVFKTIKQNGKSASFAVVDDKEKMLYEWTFVGNKITNDDVDNLDLEIKFQSDKQEQIEKATGSKNLLHLSFAHHGVLPGTATVKVYVGDRFADGTSLYFYYYNEEKNTAELVLEEIKVENGYATITISHCSEYFLTDTKLSAQSKATASQTTKLSSPNTGDQTPYTLIIIAAGASMAVITLLTRKKITLIK